MSLVNEALKKAHLEASRQRTDSVAALAPRPAPKLYSPELHKPKSGYVIALVAAVFIVALSATVLKVAATSDTGPISTFKAKVMSAPSPVATVQPRLSLPPPPAPAQGDVEAGNETRAESVAQPPRDLGRTQPLSSNYEAVADSFVTPSPGIVEGKVYIQSVDVAGAPKLILNGILWSDKPLAIINNLTTAPGEDLNDVTIVTIEPKRVKLRSQGKDFYIRLP